MKKTVFVLLAVLLSTASAAMQWFQATLAAPWGPRYCAVVAFEDTMWLMGGWRGWPDTVPYNDVWKSTDGAIWAQAIEHAAWPTRDAHAVVAFHDSMWVSGGLYGDVIMGTYPDVWCSADGARWFLAVGTAPFGPRAGHTLTVFRDTIWLAGGGVFDSSGVVTMNDVWKSGDGRTWLLADSSARWGERACHTSVVLRDTMWVIGGADWRGTFYSDVWKSGDGDSWILVTDTADWGPKVTHGSVVLGDSMWVIGGGAPFPQLGNDVWCSADGDTWLQANAAAGWKPRRHVTALAYHDRIWVMAGDTSPGLYTGSNDVWFSDIVPGIEEIPAAQVRNASSGATIMSGASAVRCLASCDIFDPMGRKVMAIAPGANDISRLAPGIYFVRTEPPVVRRVVVTR